MADRPVPIEYSTLPRAWVRPQVREITTRKLMIAGSSRLKAWVVAVPPWTEGQFVPTTGVTANGGQRPYVFSLASGSLPAGTAINAATGLITGVPTVNGSFPITFKVTDYAGTVALAAPVTILVASGAVTPLWDNAVWDVDLWG